MRGLRRSRNASAGLWSLNPSESQVDRGEAELKGEVETRKEKPEETGSRRSECGSASEGTAECGEKPRGTDGRTKTDGGESQRRERSDRFGRFLYRFEESRKRGLRPGAISFTANGF